MSEYQICKSCQCSKSISEYHKNARRKNGINSRCRDCVIKYQKTNEKYLKYRYEYSRSNEVKEKRDANKDKKKVQSQKWYEKNQEKAKSYSKKYHRENLEKRKEYRIKNREKKKKYRIENAEKAAIQIKDWRLRNIEKTKIYEKEYTKRRLQLRKERKANDPIFKIKLNLRSRTYKAFLSKGYKKNSETEKLLGASYELVKNHVESLFLDGMSWSNYGEWHIDHIIPLASAKAIGDLYNLCHYSNLQPLWGIDNLIKGDKII